MLKRFFNKRYMNTNYSNRVLENSIDDIKNELSKLNEELPEGFKDVADEMYYLYKILTQNKHKTVLDISIKLYDDEVSRYRFLEEKANRLLGFISILLPIYLAFVGWLTENKSIQLSDIAGLLIIETVFFMITIIFILLSSFRFISKPYVAITNKTMYIVKNKRIDDINLHFYTAFITSIDAYIKSNTNKAKVIAHAYNFIIVMYIFSLLSMFSISYTYLR